MYISACKKNGIFERGCDKKPDFCTRNVQVFGVQENGFLALRVKENWGCKKTVTHAEATANVGSNVLV